MRRLFLGSVVERSGKTMVSLGIMANLGQDAGYYKPFQENLVKANGDLVDQDAQLMHEALGLGPVTTLSPLRYDVRGDVSMDHVVNGFETASEGKDTMLIEGMRDITTGYSKGVSGLSISSRLSADVVLIATPEARSLDRLVMFQELCRHEGLRMRGAIVNLSEGDGFRDLIEDAGIPVLGEIPRVEELCESRVSDVMDAIDGRLLVGEGGLDRKVGEVIMGAMSPETAFRCMSRFTRKAVITGGDRPEIQMAALETDTSCLVLTGGVEPPGMVLSKAHDKGVPVILTRYQPLDAAERVDHLMARISVEDMGTISQLVRENVDLEALFPNSGT